MPLSRQGPPPSSVLLPPCCVVWRRTRKRRHQGGITALWDGRQTLRDDRPTLWDGRPTLWDGISVYHVSHSVGQSSSGFSRAQTCSQVVSKGSIYYCIKRFILSVLRNHICVIVLSFSRKQAQSSMIPNKVFC